MSKSYPIAKHSGHVSTIKMPTLMTPKLDEEDLSFCERYTHSRLFLHLCRESTVLFVLIVNLSKCKTKLWHDYFHAYVRGDY